MSTDEGIIAQAAERHAAGQPITDIQARVIASAWHGGQASALCSLATTGAIRDDLEYEIEQDISTVAADSDDARALAGLRDYARQNGKRGPQPGWSQLNW